MNAPTPEFAAIKERTPAEIVADWNRAQDVLARAKHAEATLRREVLAGAFGFNTEVDTRKGTEYFEMNGGSRLKAVFKQNYKLDSDSIDAALDSIEKHSAEGKFIAERLVKFKPELSVTEYNKLPDGPIRNFIDGVLTISPGLPSLEIVEPKAK